MSLMVVMVLLLTVALEVGEQLCWTMKSRLLRGGVIWIGAGILTHFARLAAWFVLLKLLPLSVALPLTGLDYVGVAFMGAWLFAERLDWRRWLGTGLIVAGMVLVGWGGWS